MRFALIRGEQVANHPWQRIGRAPAKSPMRSIRGMVFPEVLMDAVACGSLEFMVWICTSRFLKSDSRDGIRGSGFVVWTSMSMFLSFVYIYLPGSVLSMT